MPFKIIGTKTDPINDHIELKIEGCLSELKEDFDICKEVIVCGRKDKLLQLILEMTRNSNDFGELGKFIKIEYMVNILKEFL